MSLRYGFLCILLLLFVLLLVLKNYEIWTTPIELLPEKGTVKKSVMKTDSQPMGSQKEKTSIESNIFVAEKNIFTPERKEFPVIVTPPSPEMKKPVVRPKIILYGVTIAEGYQSASIVNPGRPLKKGEREITSLKVGESIGEYKIAKILPDRIVLEGTGDSFEVLLYDPKAPKQRTYVKTETKPATITSTLPSPAPTPIPKPPSTQAIPGAKAEPIEGKVIEAQVPRPVTPAPVPTPRARRWWGPKPPGEAD